MTLDPVVGPLSLINSNPPKPEQFQHMVTNFSNTMSVHPDKQLSKSDQERHRNLRQQFDRVFNPGAYNDYSDCIRTKLNLGPVKPPPRKGKLPFHDQSNLRLPQKETDKLEALGVFAKREDVRVDVVYVSSSFVVKKPQGEHCLVTAFNDLDQYSHIFPTASTSCNYVPPHLSS